MAVIAILFVVIFAASATSVTIYPENLQEYDSKFVYHLQPKESGSDISEEKAESYEQPEDENGQRKLDDVSKRDSYRAVQKENNEEDADIVEYDEPREEYREDEAKVENGDTSKVDQSENVKEEEREGADENEEEKGEVTDENENYENSEEQDDFKWPFGKGWFGEYGKYKGYDDYDRAFGSYGKFGKYGSLGAYTDYGSRSKFGCLELGHGEYC